MCHLLPLLALPLLLLLLLLILLILLQLLLLLLLLVLLLEEFIHAAKEKNRDLKFDYGEGGNNKIQYSYVVLFENAGVDVRTVLMCLSTSVVISALCSEKLKKKRKGNGMLLSVCYLTSTRCFVKKKCI